MKELVQIHTDSLEQVSLTPAALFSWLKDTEQVMNLYFMKMCLIYWRS